MCVCFNYIKLKKAVEASSLAETTATAAAAAEAKAATTLRRAQEEEEQVVLELAATAETVLAEQQQQQQQCPVTSTAITSGNTKMWGKASSASAASSTSADHKRQTLREEVREGVREGFWAETWRAKANSLQKEAAEAAVEAKECSLKAEVVIAAASVGGTAARKQVCCECVRVCRSGGGVWRCVYCVLCGGERNQVENPGL